MDKEFKETEEGKRLVKKFEEMLATSYQIFFTEEDFEYLIAHYLTLNRSKKALAAVNCAIEQYPYSSELLLEKARILFDSEKYQQALDLIDTIQNLQPNDIDVLLIKGAILTSLERYQEAIHVLSDALDAQEELEEVYYSIGLAYQSWGNYEEAIVNYKQAIELNLNHEDATYELAYCLDITDKLEESISYYQQFIDNDPFSPNAWYNIGVVYSKMFQWENAIRAYEYATLLKEDLSSAYFNKGNAHMNLGSFSEANECYKTTLELEGPTPDVLCCIAATYEKMELYESAISHFKQAFKIDINYHEAYYGIGSCLEAQQKWFEAIHFFRKASHLDENNSIYLMALADAEYNTGNIASANECYEKVANLEPLNVDIWLNWSFIYYEQNEFDKAAEIVEQGTVELPHEAELYYRAAIYLIQDRKYKQAFEFLEIALTLDFDKHLILFEFFTDLQTQKALHKIVDQYKNS
jgi:tetratricopeptide (TPR) repeat protein